MASREHVFVTASVVLVLLVAYTTGVSDTLRLDSSKVVGPYLDLVPFWSLVDHTFSSASGGPLGRPVAMLTFLAQSVTSSDLAPSEIFFGNILLHCATFIALALLIKILLKELHSCSDNRASIIGVMGASFWAVLPIHSSTVLYAVQRMTILATLFGVISLVCFVRFIRLREIGNAPTRGPIIAVALTFTICFLLAVFSKENAFTLVPIVVAYTIFSAYQQSRPRQMDLPAALLCLNVTILVTLIAAYFYFVDGYGNRDFSIDERIKYQLVAFWVYLKQSVVPVIGDLGLFHDDFASTTDIGYRNLFLSTLGLLALLGFQLIFLSSNKWRLAGFGITILLYGHLIETTVVPLEIFFEHRSYFPNIGLGMVLSNAILVLGERLQRLWLPFVLLFFGLASYSYGLVQAAYPYQTNEHFSIKAVLNSPASARAQSEAAVLFAKRGELHLALGHLERFFQQKPVRAELEKNILRVSLICFGGASPENDVLNAIFRAADASQMTDALALKTLRNLPLTTSCAHLTEPILNHLFDLVLAGEFDMVQLQEIALMAFEAGSYEKSIRVNKRMLELNPNHAQSLFMQMHALLLLNRAVEAEGIFSILKVWKDEGKLGFYQSRILDMYAEEFDALAQAETQ